MKSNILIVGQKSIFTKRMAAWLIIETYIKNNNYSWTYEQIKHDYKEYYLKGYYISHTLQEIINKFEIEMRLVFES